MITFMKKLLIMMILMWGSVGYARDLTVQLFLYDNITQRPFSTDVMLNLSAVLLPVDVNPTEIEEYDTRMVPQNQIVGNGILEIKIPFDNTNQANLFLYDQKDLKLVIYFHDMIDDGSDDILSITLNAVPLSIISELSDRVEQTKDRSVFDVNYFLRTVGIGMPASTSALSVAGSIRADFFEGDATYVSNLLGAGLSDDYSLERKGSRTCSNLIYATGQDCSTGDDIVFADRNAFLGIGTTEPEMLFDVRGVVLFTNGEAGIGGLDFNNVTITRNKSIFLWNYQNASLMAGTVSDNSSLDSILLSDSSFGIGNEIKLNGRNSAVLGGEKNEISGDYSAIVGGRHHILNGDYSVIIGGENETISDGYVASIGGKQNNVKSEFSVLVSAENNSLIGNYNTIIGNNNLVNGKNVAIINGSQHYVTSNQTIIMGDRSIINHDNIWMINMTSDKIGYTTDSHQVVWFSDHGVSINTGNITEALSIQGVVKGDYFYGNGSMLTNINFVDPYWNLIDSVMTNQGYRLSLNTTQAQNRMALKHGLVLSNHSSTIPGSMSFINGNLVGYTSSGSVNLIIQDSHLMFNFSPEFDQNELADTNKIQLVRGTESVKEYLVYNGSIWVSSKKTGWISKPDSLQYYRPISIWGNSFQGMLTLANIGINQMLFLDANETKGVSLAVFNTQSSRLGFNSVYKHGGDQKIKSELMSFKLSFDSANGGFLVDNDLYQPLMRIGSTGRLNILGSGDSLDMNVPGPSKVSTILIDENDNNNSMIIFDGHLPVLLSNVDGQVSIQADNSQSISFQERLKITNDGEFAMSYYDSFQGRYVFNLLSQPFLTISKGDLMLNNTSFIGVFDLGKTLRRGIKFNHKSIIAYPGPTLSTDFVSFNEQGLGIRVQEPDSVININDNLGEASIFLNVADSTQLVFRRNNIDFWKIKSGLNDLFSILNASDVTGIVFENNKININTPENPLQDININGSLSFVGDTRLLRLTSLSGLTANVIESMDSGINIRPFTNSDGLVFYSNQKDGLIIRDQSVGINGSDSNYKLYVNQPTYISDYLQYFEEDVLSKTVRTFNGVSYGNNKYNIKVLSFNDGFIVTDTGNNIATLSFENHFSTFNLVTLDASRNMTSEVDVTANGVDQVRFTGTQITIIANDISNLGSEIGAMDSLTFKNDLINGGSIDGTLNVSETVSANYLRGDISKMHDIPFPWQHIVTENGIRVDYEYVNNIDVGIGTSLPIVDLQVIGNITSNILNSPSINIKGGSISSGGHPLLIRSKPVAGDPSGDSYSISMNVVSAVNLNNLSFSVNQENLGLNSIDSNYKLTLSPGSKPDDSLLLIKGDSESKMTFYSSGIKGQFHLTNTQFNIGENAQNLALSIDDTKVVNLNSFGVGIGTVAMHPFDVFGNVRVGYNNNRNHSTFFPNSLVVIGNLGVYTDTPLFRTDIRGSMVVGDSSTNFDTINLDDNSMYIKNQLLVNQTGSRAVHVDTGLAINNGGLFFKNVQQELSFMPTFNQVMVGYPTVISNRSLAIKANSSMELKPLSSVTGMIINLNGNVGLGTNVPDYTFHINNNNINVLIDSVGNDATLKFGTNGGFHLTPEGTLIITDDDINNVNTVSGIQIDASGNVDVGYGVNITPTHDVELDVLNDINATSIQLNGQGLTHMPIGSIIMWSGWTTELPDGWKLCTGSDSSTTTTACNFVDKFIEGVETSPGTVSPRNPVLVKNVGDDIHIHNHGTHNHTSGGTASFPTSTSTSHSDQETLDDNAIDYQHTNIGDTTNLIKIPFKRTKAGEVHEEDHPACGNHKNEHLSGTDPCGSDLADAYYTNLTYNSTGHTHAVSKSHDHTVSFSAPSNHNHGFVAVDDQHSGDAAHQHDVSSFPVFYRLAFIYLEGVQ